MRISWKAEFLHTNLSDLRYPSRIAQREHVDPRSPAYIANQPVFKILKCLKLFIYKNLLRVAVHFPVLYIYKSNANKC